MVHRMARKYIDKKTKERYKKLAWSEDYKQYVTEKVPPIPEFHDSIAAKRMIYLKDVSAETGDFGKILSEKISELNQAAEETSKYIQHVNEHLDLQKVKINELKKFQKTFERQLTSLDSAKDE